MILGIDHVVIAVRDLEAASGELPAGLGLEVVEGGRHLALGTRNALCWLGDSYLELLAVTDASLAARSWIGAPAIASLSGGGGVATWALASDDLAADVRRLRAQGSSLIGPLPGERLRPDGRAERWLLALLPELAPDRPPFLIEHLAGSPEWHPDARRDRDERRHAAGHVRLRRLEIPVDDPGSVARSYRTELGLRASAADAAPAAATSADSAVVAVGVQSVVLRPASAPARHPVTIVLSSDVGSDRDVEMLGCRFVVERAEVG